MCSCTANILLTFYNVSETSHVSSSPDTKHFFDFRHPNYPPLRVHKASSVLSVCLFDSSCLHSKSQLGPRRAGTSSEEDRDTSSLFVILSLCIEGKSRLFSSTQWLQTLASTGVQGVISVHFLDKRNDANAPELVENSRQQWENCRRKIRLMSAL